MKQVSSSLTKRHAARLHAIPAVAERLDVSAKTVRRLIASGALVAHRTGNSVNAGEKGSRRAGVKGNRLVVGVS